MSVQSNVAKIKENASKASIISLVSGSIRVPLRVVYKAARYTEEIMDGAATVSAVGMDCSANYLKSLDLKEIKKQVSENSVELI